jgi:hypothetical protein
MIQNSSVQSDGAAAVSVRSFLRSGVTLREYYHLITAWKATKQEEQIYAENV